MSGGVRGSEGRAVALLAGVLLACVAAGGCDSAPAPVSDAPGRESPEPPEPRYESAEALCRAALAALEAKDRAALERLLITEEAYRRDYYPDLQLAKPRSKIPVQYHWELLGMNRKKCIGRMLHDFGGASLELLEVVPESVDDYAHSRIWNRVKLRVLERGKPEEHWIRVFGSLFEKDGRFSAFGFAE